MKIKVDGRRIQKEETQSSEAVRTKDQPHVALAFC